MITDSTLIAPAVIMAARNKCGHDNVGECVERFPP
jgi:hypothetical protein